MNYVNIKTKSPLNTNNKEKQKLKFAKQSTQNKEEKEIIYHNDKTSISQVFYIKPNKLKSRDKYSTTLLIKNNFMFAL